LKAADKPKAKPQEAVKKEDGKTLVAYATKGGATNEAANIISKMLQEKFGLQVDLVDLRRQPKPDVTGYRNIVVGGGVRAGKVYKEAVEFVKQDFNGKRVAFFICSGAAGNPLHHDEVAEKYITKGLVGAFNVKLVFMEAFGGCIRIFGIAVVDRRDPAKIQAWAEELGKKFSE
jgi:menaquinone-dependent protoporphyrinogen IX oxidase